MLRFNTLRFNALRWKLAYNLIEMAIGTAPESSAKGDLIFVIHLFLERQRDKLNAELATREARAAVRAAWGL